MVNTMYRDDCDEYDSLYTGYHYDSSKQLKNLENPDVIDEFNNAKCCECFIPCCGNHYNNEPACCTNCLLSTLVPCFPIYMASKDMNDMMIEDENGCVNCIQDPWTSGVISAAGCSMVCATGCFSGTLIPAATASILETVGCLSVAFPAIFNGWRWDDFRHKVQGKNDGPKCGSSMFVFLNGLFCTPCIVFETHKRSGTTNNQRKNGDQPKGTKP